MNFRSETGIILISVLVFLILFSWFSLHILGQGVLTIKISGSTQDNLKNWVAAENRLCEVERDVQQQPEQYPRSQKKFVADHLGFECEEGVDIFSLQIPPLKSTVAVRTPDPDLHIPSAFPQCGWKSWSGNAKALFEQQIMPKTQMDQTAKLWDGVFVGAPYSKRLEILPGYLSFKEKYQQRPLKIYLLANTCDKQNGMLYKIDGASQQEIAMMTLPFPISKGYLVNADILLDGHWRTVLIMIASGREKGKEVSAKSPAVKKKASQIASSQMATQALKQVGMQKTEVWVFDVTDPKTPLNPIFTQEDCDGGDLTLKPIVFRHADKGFAMVFSDTYQKTGRLFIRHFEKGGLGPPTVITLSHQGLRQMVAIDEHQEASANRLYGFDDSMLWTIDLAPLVLNTHKLLPGAFTSAPLVVPHAQAQGIHLYLLGKTAKGTGLFKVTDNLMKGGRETSVTLVAPGDYVALFIRFGSLVLVPKKEGLSPTIIDLSDHQLVSGEWHQQVVDAEEAALNKNEQASAVQTLLAKLLWDEQSQQDILVILNASCQLKMQTLRFPYKKYGRLSWQKMMD